jgi:HEAT repeat protein
MKFLQIVMIVAMFGSSRMQAQSRAVSEVVAAANANPNDLGVVGQVVAEFNRTADTTLWVAMKELFGKASTRLVRQTLALALLQQGEKDEVYIDDLLKYAREAIDTTAPLPVEYDQQGNALKGHVAPAFERWCKSNGFELRECLDRVYAYPLDVLMLARAKDRRAIPLLRQALSVENHATAEMAVRGLAWLNDTDSIPLVAQQLVRFRPKLAQSVAAAVAEFSDPRVGPILDRFVTDRKLRQEINDTIRKPRGQIDHE